MAGSTGPNLGLVWGYSAGDSGWGINGYNPGFAILDTLVQGAILSIEDTPPGSPTNGDRYIVGTSPTGAWIGHENAVAVYLTIGTPDWTFLTPKTAWRMFDIERLVYIRYNGSAWEDESYSAGKLNISEKTANFSITAAESGTVFANTGAVGAVLGTLPAAEAGLNYTFVVDAVQSFGPSADTGEFIHNGPIQSTTAGGSLTSDAAHSSITIVAHTTGFWVVTSIIGAWSDA